MSDISELPVSVFTFKCSVTFIFSITVFPLFFTVIVYLITSPGLTVVFEVFGLYSSVPTTLIPTTSFLTSINDNFSTSVSVLSLSLTSSGFLPSVFAVTSTSFSINLASFLYISVSYVTVYSAFISFEAPASNSFIVILFTFCPSKTIPANLSFTSMFVNFLLPLFVTVI